MKILVDLTALDDNFSGIERFALSITKELIKDNNNQFILIFKNKVHKEFLENRSNVEKIVAKGKNKLIFYQLILPFKLRKISADYYLFPAFPAPFFFFSKKSISAIHDTSCWDCPSSNKKHMLYYFRILYRKAVMRDKKIITVSEFSKNRIMDILHAKSNKIAVIYDGLSECFCNFKYDKSEEGKAIKKYNLPEKYLLCLSTLEPRKNLRLLIDVYVKLIEEKKTDLDLLLAGRKGWLIDDLLNNLPKNVTEKIHFTGFVDDEHLPYIYKNAEYFIFPSMYEGFGVPPIEAMSMETPVISSNATSLPEVLKDAAVYFENNDKESLYNTILSTQEIKENEKDAMLKKARNVAFEYSWKNEAKKLLKFILN